MAQQWPDYSASLQFWDYSIVQGPGHLKWHFHHYWQMNLADTGEALFHCGNKKYQVKKWNILIIPPYCRHEIVYPIGQFGCFSFKFHMRILRDEIFEALLLTESRETKIYISIVKTLIQEFFPNEKQELCRRDVPVTGDDDYVSILEPLLHALLIRYYKRGNNRLTLSGQLRQLLIKKNGHPISVAEAAKYFSYSAGHFSILIKTETGLNAKQFIDRERFRIACHYLEFTHMNVTEVASQMGFPDTLTFCHFFQKQCGSSPGVFRKSFHTGISLITMNKGGIRK